jgi:ribonuclease HII
MKNSTAAVAENRRKALRSSATAAVSVPDLTFERAAWDGGHRLVAGIDEVGRGALAGPVVAAAVILDPEHVPDGLDDSKRLTARQREALAEQVLATALCVRIGCVEADEIDRVNILRATLLAMRQAADALDPAADHLLVDGNVALPSWPRSQLTVVRGDGLSVSIAAASIVAKVVRDRTMCELHERWPDYCFDDNAGYGTAAHRSALERLGPTPIHRRSFRGVLTPSTPSLFD